MTETKTAHTADPWTVDASYAHSEAGGEYLIRSAVVTASGVGSIVGKAWERADADLFARSPELLRERAALYVELNERREKIKALELVSNSRAYQLRGANAGKLALREALAAIVPAYEAALERLAELGQGFGAAGSAKVLPDARKALEEPAPFPVTETAGAREAFQMMARLWRDADARAVRADERAREATARAERAEDRAATLAEAAGFGLEALRRLRSTFPDTNCGCTIETLEDALQEGC
jgi:hypothetical protein